MTRADAGYVVLNPRPLGGHSLLLRYAGTGGRVLDVGCSSGYLAEELAKRGARVVGIELDPAAARLAARWCDDVLVGDVEQMELPFAPASFDTVVCGDVIEHLRDPESLLRRLRPLLRAGGRLVLSTPNVANWTIRIGLLFGRFRYSERGILDRSHTQLFTRKTLIEALERTGYRVEAFDYTVPVPVIGTPAVERLAHALARVRPSLFAYQFVVAASPR